MAFIKGNFRRIQTSGSHGENVLAPRAWFVPCADVDEAMALVDDRIFGVSTRVAPLDGEWECLYLSDSESFEGFDYPYAYDVRTIPHCWQTDGYESPMYLNVAYPFPCLDGQVFDYNPLMVYRRYFEVISGDRFILRFEGVSSNLELYINGEYVGYSECSHMTAEYDITSYVHEGTNEIYALVRKWCVGSYLENQDFFRMNGIFRSVYLVCQYDAYLDDLRIDTNDLGKGDWRLDVDIDSVGADVTEVSLIDADGVNVRLDYNEGRYSVCLKPRLWSAEDPNLYTLLVTLYRDGVVVESSTHDVGFKKCRIVDKVFYYNDYPIKLLGVNYHDSHPTNGWAISVEDIKADLLNMKRFNIHAIRTSHYPKTPAFYALCNRLGFYVLDEADIEAHGAFTSNGDANYYAEVQDFEARFLDRVSRMYLRDRNNPCIFMWSLGNESGGLANHDKCYAYLKSMDPHNLVHYEPAVFHDRKGYDVVSMMYANYNQCIEHSTSDNPMPFILCEYVHSMGMGPGGLKEYVELMDSYPSFMGGFVWEYCDHVVETDGTYKYGGESGEYIHDSNFCCDGVFLPDRTPSSSAYEISAAYSPIKSELIDHNLVITNNSFFVDSTDYGMYMKVYRDGVEICSRVITDEIGPRSSITFPVDEVDGGEIYVEFGYDNSFGAHYEASHHLSGRYIPTAVEGPVSFSEDARDYVFTSLHSTVRISKRSGAIVSMTSHGIECLASRPESKRYNPFMKDCISGFYPSVTRPYIDNEMYYKSNWIDNLYHLHWISTDSVVYDPLDMSVTVKGYLTPPKFIKQFGYTIRYVFDGDGTFRVESDLIPYRLGLPYLQRFGLDIDVSTKLKHIEYYGLGDRENYPDMKLSARICRYTHTLDSWSGPTVVPQESGMRCDVRWAKILDDNGVGIELEMIDEPIAINLSRYSIDAINSAAHLEDLTPMNVTRLSVNGFVSGVGSWSCGPEIPEEFRVSSEIARSFGFRVRLI